jgi:tetratricopeptide (TPR) repeat protein
MISDPESKPLPAVSAVPQEDLVVRPGNWWRSPAICALLAAMTLTAFWPLLHADFVNFDDPGYIYENPHVGQGLSKSSLAWAFTAMIQYNWHPLTWISHMTDVQLFGMNPHRHHAVNLALHIVSTLALFLLLQWLTRSTWCSAAVAAFFAVHPMHVESVAWASERKDQLSTLFGLATIAVYACYARRTGIARYALYAAVVLLFTLGLLAKPMLVTLPCLLLLLDFWPLDRLRARGEESLWRVVLWRALEKVPLLVLSAASAWITFIAQRKGGSVCTLSALPLWLRGCTAMLGYARYAGKMFYPRSLSFFYPYDLTPNWLMVSVAGLFLLAVSLLVIWGSRHGRRYLVFGWLWYLGILVPVIGLVQVGDQAIADRYSYASYIGLFVMVAWSVAELVTRWRSARIATAVVVAVALVACVGKTQHQLQFWQNSEALLLHALELYPRNHIAHANLGVLKWERNDHDGAVKEWREALDIAPQFADVHSNLGLALWYANQRQEALQHLDRALAIQPNHVAARGNLALVFTQLGRPELAVPQLQQVLQLDPDRYGAAGELGRIYMSQGKIREALEMWGYVIQRQPNDVLTLNLAAWWLATSPDDSLRNGTLAVQLAERAVQLCPAPEPAVLDTLAAAYAEAGRYDDAVRAVEMASTVALQKGSSPFTDAMRARRELYRNKKPMRDNRCLSGSGSHP